MQQCPLFMACFKIKMSEIRRKVARMQDFMRVRVFQIDFMSIQRSFISKQRAYTPSFSSKEKEKCQYSVLSYVQCADALIQHLYRGRRLLQIKLYPTDLENTIEGTIEGWIPCVHKKIHGICGCFDWQSRHAHHFVTLPISWGLVLMIKQKWDLSSIQNSVTDGNMGVHHRVSSVRDS